MKQKSLISSPCISVCSLDEDTGYCRGCWRAPEEIARWEHYNDDQKRAVLLRLQERQKL